MDILKIVDCFDLSGKAIDVVENTAGNINNTYVVSVLNDGIVNKYILQRLNDNVFKDPYLVMENISKVTDYCKDYLNRIGEDSDRRVLSVVRTKTGEVLLKTDNLEYYRMFNYVSDTITYNKPKDKEMFYSVGVAFGDFVRMLDGYPVSGLGEIIPDFHNSKIRFKNFCSDVSRDVCGRVKEVLPEIKFIMDRAEEFNIIIDMINNGDIPLRVTHNDTKMNNVLIDNNTDKAVCVIDLDTVMPGSILYDFGDAIRFGAAYTYEDDSNIDNVGINIEYFKSFSEGYLSKTLDILTEKEIQYLAFSCRLLTLELAMRFLNDYINGDIYFKYNYDKHNLDRARNQIRLVQDMELHYEEMTKIIDKSIVKIRKKK